MAWDRARAGAVGAVRETGHRRPNRTRGPEIQIQQHHGPYGRMRVRSAGRPSGLPEIVLVQGMAVAEYLAAGIAELGTVTRTHLVELPGLAGAGEPPHELNLTEYAAAVVDWLDAYRAGPVVLGGHSAGTQVAARAAADGADVAGLLLAGPTVDPALRTWPRLVRGFLANGRVETDGPTGSHVPEWRRAGVRRIRRFVAMSLADRIETSLEHVRVPILVLRGRDDRLSTASWARGLARPDSDRYTEMPGAHSFPWAFPAAWVDPVRRFLVTLAGP